MDQLPANPTLPYQNSKSKVISGGISDVNILGVIIPWILPFNSLCLLHKIDAELKVNQMVSPAVLMFLTEPSCWSNQVCSIYCPSPQILIKRKAEAICFYLAGIAVHFYFPTQQSVNSCSLLQFSFQEPWLSYHRRISCWITALTGRLIKPGEQEIAGTLHALVL